MLGLHFVSGFRVVNNGKIDHRADAPETIDCIGCGVVTGVGRIDAETLRQAVASSD